MAWFAFGPCPSAHALRGLARLIDLPTSLQEAGISPQDFEARLPKLVGNAINDSAMLISPRFPEDEEVEQILRYAYEGKSIDF